MLKPISANHPLILASSSKYRAELLARLRIPFVGIAPEIDEAPQQSEAAEALSRRLARAKAKVLSRKHPDRWVLGSDQAASCDGQILGKPGSHARAVEQLQLASGRTMDFHTSVTLMQGSFCETLTDLTCVKFRTLETAEIERYLAQEPAYDCAGSFKCEGLGITLFDSIESRDPTALIGLPLIAVRRLLASAELMLP